MEDKINLVIAGHDLKFMKDIIDYFKNNPRYDVRIDKWVNHTVHNESYSMDCVNWADVVFCEWGLGNAVWYSQNIKKGTKLIVRVHRQELMTKFPENYNMDNIDYIITISPYVKKVLKEKIKCNTNNKFIDISNAINTHLLDKPKLPGAFKNIGMLGYCPKLKRPDRAIHIFNNIMSKCPQYTLYIKGNPPDNYKWLWAQEEQREYYYDLDKLIAQSKWKDKIIFEKWDEDISEWFRKIGFILSVSDIEGSHVAATEGMASGCIPVFRNWNGADMLYPTKYIFDDNTKASDFIIKLSGTKNIEAESKSVKDLIRLTCDKEIICKKLDDIFTG